MRKLCLTATIFLSSNILQAQSKIFTAHLPVNGITTTTTFYQDDKISVNTEKENAYSTDQTLSFYPGIYSPIRGRLRGKKIISINSIHIQVLSSHT
jgi:hypothetical protein